ncbi:unnamed protein product [Adineta steineri]|nr:unnamed protein product [Adineta steineri]
MELLSWLCGSDVSNNKPFMKSIFSTISFRENDRSQITTLKEIKYYDEMNMSPLLPLPVNVLPARIAAHISNDNLNNRLSLAQDNSTTAEVQLQNLNDNQIDTSGLVDYVHFGPDGNSFLRNIGVCDRPSASVLAKLLLDRQANFFANPEGLEKKTRAYLKCLKDLESLVSKASDILDQTLIGRLRNEPWCLAFVYLGNSSEQTFQIAAPKDIYLIDDYNIASCFRPLSPPVINNFNEFYKKFGSYTGELRRTNRANELRDRIVFRLDLLVTDRRGKRMVLVNEKALELLRKSLIVYEVDEIKCQWTFRGKSVLSADKITCALEHSETKVELYIKFQTETNYIDVASVITRLLLSVCNDEQIMVVQFKLAQSLEEIQRFGFPVDRLLKSAQEKTDNRILQRNLPTTTDSPMIDSSSPKSSRKSKTNGSTEHLDDEMNGDTNSILNDSRNTQTTSNPTTNTENYDEISTNSIQDDIEELMEPYNQPIYCTHDRILTNRTSNNPCESPANLDLQRYKDLFHGIPLFTEKTVRVTKPMLNRARQLATILSGLATQVFSVPGNMMNLYRDSDANKAIRCSFHHKGPLFFNVRYFESTFAEQFDSEPENVGVYDSNMHKVINFYFMNTCHLLVHNTCFGHDTAFIRRLEHTLIKFLPAKDSFLEVFKFSWNFQ